MPDQAPYSGSDETPLRVRLHSITQETEAINLYEFRPLRGQLLPPFEAGAHIDLHLPGNLTRSYSLINPQGERGRYVVAVKHEVAGRGGSRAMHSDLRVGTEITIKPPRNNFPLQEDAAHSVFIAGGIGITPLFCMARRLEQLGRPWEMHYAALSREAAAFVPELEALGKVTFYFLHDPGHPAAMEVGTLVGGLPGGADLYCCGPLGMLSDFETATASLPPERVHAEYFSAKTPPANEGGFEVLLQRSGMSVTVKAGETILDAVIKAGIDVPYSCMEGVCGSCQVAVLDGIPEHRDLILSPQEHEANDTMLICCSGSKSGRLVLDL